jgi:hypothetical protein
MRYRFEVIEVRSIRRFYEIEADNPGEAQAKASIGDTFEEYDDEGKTYDVIERDVDDASMVKLEDNK